MVIVEDQPKMLPPEIASIEEIFLLVQHMNMPIIHEMGHLEEHQCMEEGGTFEECDEKTWTEPTVSGKLQNYAAVNAMFQPTIPVIANRWYRLRMGYMTPDGDTEITIPGCDMELLAKDGIYLHTAPRTVTSIYMGPGTRTEVLVRCPPGEYEMRSPGPGPSQLVIPANPLDEPEPEQPFVELLATFKATDTGEKPCSLPSFEVNRPVSGCDTASSLSRSLL